MGEWEDQLLYRPGKRKTDDPELLRVVANAVTILANDEAWAGVLAYDAFGECVITLRPPPWHNDDAPAEATSGTWTDADTIRTTAWLSRQYQLHVGTTVVHEAVSVVAARRIVHPVRDWLDSLEWDGAPRIDTWLIDCAGCEDTEYTRAVGAKFLISAVARVARPGCKVDSVLIFEGAQGRGKSTLARTLAHEESWFLETQSDVGTKDSLQQLRRRWIVELAELDALNRAEMARVKAFLSSQVDTYRASYGRFARDYPRQCVFIGTTNAANYLADATGGRRFWPVRCGQIDIPKAKAIRAQLWAEARVRFERGEAWHVDSAELARLFEQEQDARYQGDPWEPAIAGWVGSKGHPERRREGVTTADILRHALAIEVNRWSRADEMRAGAVLRRLGWERGQQETRDGIRIRPYRPMAVQEVKQVVQRDGSEKTSESSPSTPPAHPPVGAYTQARARRQPLKETGGGGCAVVQRDGDLAEVRVAAPGTNGVGSDLGRDEPVLGAWLDAQGVA